MTCRTCSTSSNPRISPPGKSFPATLVSTTARQRAGRHADVITRQRDKSHTLSIRQAMTVSDALQRQISTPPRRPASIVVVIDHSPASARLAGVAGAGHPLHQAAELPVERRGLAPGRSWLAGHIRGRTQFTRTRMPLQRDQQLFWEYLNLRPGPLARPHRRCPGGGRPAPRAHRHQDRRGRSRR